METKTNITKQGRHKKKRQGQINYEKTIRDEKEDIKNLEILIKKLKKTTN